MQTEQFIKKQIQETIEVKQKLLQECSQTIEKISDAILQSLKTGGTLYLCGNGGSAADAQHVATELVGRYLRERKPLAAVALTTNTSLLTAIGNDYDFGRIFSRQVEAMITPRDVLAAISTSGKSSNILLAVEAAKKQGAVAIGFTGSPGNPLAQATDLCLCVPSQSTPRIQEAHILAWHIICDLIEQAFSHQ